MGIRGYLWNAEKKPGFWGFWGYLWGYRNRVSVVGIRGYLWNAEKKPGFWGFWVSIHPLPTVILK